MDAVTTVANAATSGTSSTTKRGLSSVAPEDFMQLLITQLQYQDPFKPMDNAEMLSQMSEIRNMEMSMTLTDSLKALTGQQRFGSAATLIGRYVTGTVTTTDGTSVEVAGLVRSVRFDDDGQPILELDSGGVLPLKNLTNVTDPTRLVGKYVMGRLVEDDGTAQAVEGVVKAVRFTQSGEAELELANGTRLPLSGVVLVSDAPSTSATNPPTATTLSPPTGSSGGAVGDSLPPEPDVTPIVDPGEETP